MRRFYTAEVLIEKDSSDAPSYFKYASQQFIFGTRNERDSFAAMIDHEPGMQVISTGTDVAHTTVEALKACRAIRDA